MPAQSSTSFTPPGSTITPPGALIKPNTEFSTADLISRAKRTMFTSGVFDETLDANKHKYGRAFNQYINKSLFVNQESPDVSGYTFIYLEPPDLSGLTAKNPEVPDLIKQICQKSLFLALDVTPPSISVNVEEINTKASVSMPYATTKVATGTLSISFLDNANMDINSLHNVWVEYIYNQLWGDLEPAAKYLDPDKPEFGSLDYATSAFIIKYDPSFTDPPVMVGKATGIFPTGVPVKEPLGSRTNRELVMQSVSYTCSYYEVVHPRALLQTYATSNDPQLITILDEIIHISDRFKT